MTMRRKANLSLLLLSVLFVISLWLKWTLNDPWWSNALLFIAEAGMVGALADWFAVTALFRHPLGFKWIPHTAIVPKNRDKLVDGMVYLVEEQLLNKEMIEKQLDKINITEMLISMVDKKWDQTQTEQLLSSLLSKSANMISSEKLARSCNDLLKQKLLETNGAHALGRGLVYALDKKYDVIIIEKVLDIASDIVAKREVRDAIKNILESEKDKMLGGGSGGWLKNALFSLAQSFNAVNFDDAADVIHRDLILLLIQMKNENHELRVLLSEQLMILAKLLQKTDGSVAETIEEWKKQLLEEIELTDTLHNIIAHIQATFIGEANGDKRAYPYLQKWIYKLIETYWAWFKQDEKSKLLLERKIKHFIGHLIAHEHVLIGKIVRSTLDSFSEARLVEFIEDKVEVDLQRIRVNGALIGAAIGALLYGVLYGLYTPLLQTLGLL